MNAIFLLYYFYTLILYILITIRSFVVQCSSRRCFKPLNIKVFPPTTDFPPRETAAPPAAETPVAPPVTETAVANRPKVPKRPEPSRVPPPMRPRPAEDPDLLKELSFKGPIWLVAGLVALALILTAGVYQLIRNKGKLPGGAVADATAKRVTNRPESPDALLRFPVSFESNVPGTRFSEDGQTLEPNAQLSAGNHNVEAFHEGYLPESRTVSVDPSSSEPLAVKFDLRAILPLLRLSSSIPRGRMLLDETESLDLQSGVASKEDIAIGPHTVKIYDGRRQVFAFAFEAKANAIPTLLTPLSAQPVAGVVVASLSGSAKVYASAGVQAAASLPVSAVPAAGLALTGSPENPAHFFLDNGKGKGPQEQSVDSSVFPALTVQLAGAADVSYLAITANASDCQITVDGKPLKRNANGQTLSVPLDPGNHPVRLSCPGFQDMEQVAVVKAGEVSPHKLDFEMTPIAARHRCPCAHAGTDSSCPACPLWRPARSGCLSKPSSYRNRWRRWHFCS